MGFPEGARFVVDANIMEELYTHREKGEEPNLSSTSDRACGLLQKIDGIRRLGWFDDPVRFEVEAGRPASEAPLLDLENLTEAPLLSALEQAMMKEHEKQLGSWLFHDTQIPQVHGDALKQLKSVAGSRKVWPELAGFIQCDHVQAYIEEQALRMGQSAGKHGWRVS